MSVLAVLLRTQQRGNHQLRAPAVTDAHAASSFVGAVRALMLREPPTVMNLPP